MKQEMMDSSEFLPLPFQSQPQSENIFSDRLERRGLKLLEHIHGSAFMLSWSGEVIWWNSAGLSLLYPGKRQAPTRKDERGVLSLLTNRKNVEAWWSHILGRIFNKNGYLSSDIAGDIYFDEFREGMFVFVSQNNIVDDIRLLRVNRSKLIDEVVSDLPSVSSDMVVFCADMQNSMGLCRQLPAYEYFEFMQELRAKTSALFRKFNGTHGTSTGDGFYYYFLPECDNDSEYVLNSIRCALSLRDLMKEITLEWQKRRSWKHEFLMNIGLHHGHEWSKVFNGPLGAEMIVMGDTVNECARLADLGRDGLILCSKALISAIPSRHQHQISYGVMRENAFSEFSFTRVRDYFFEEMLRKPKLFDIEMMAITQLVAFNE